MRLTLVTVMWEYRRHIGAVSFLPFKYLQAACFRYTVSQNVVLLKNRELHEKRKVILEALHFLNNSEISVLIIIIHVWRSTHIHLHPLSFIWHYHRRSFKTVTHVLSKQYGHKAFIILFLEACSCCKNISWKNICNHPMVI